MDHVGAVTYIDYAPTGREFVSGSYDKSIRIFETNKGHSREIYHTKRMQRLTCVQWTLDNKYILSGSDEMNIRIWKARASEKLGPVSLLTICNSLFFLIIFIFQLKPREKAALNYSEALKEKYAAHPQVRRIARHRHVPKHVYNAQKELKTIKDRSKRKEANRRVHSKQGEIPYESEKSKHVIKEDR